MSTPLNFLVDNWYWAAAALASGGTLLWMQLKEGNLNAGLTPTLAVQLINKEKAQVIDVCSAQEYAAGHIAGAKNVPLEQIASGKGLPSNRSCRRWATKRPNRCPAASRPGATPTCRSTSPERLRLSHGAQEPMALRS
jgi:hypothetical protein